MMLIGHLNINPDMHLDAVVTVLCAQYLRILQQGRTCNGGKRFAIGVQKLLTCTFH